MKVLRASRRSRTLSGSDKAKTAVGVAVAYVEDVLGLTTHPSEFAADRSRSLFSDRLLNPVRFSCHLFLVDLIVLKDLFYIIPGGLVRRDSLILPDLPGTSIVCCKGQFDISVKLVQKLLEIRDTRIDD